MYCIESSEPGKSDLQHIVKEIHRRIPYMKICPGLLLYIIPFIEIFRQEHGVIQINIWHDFIICIGNIRLKSHHIYRPAVSEKGFGSYRF